MGQHVCMGAMMTCSFGVAPSSLVVIPKTMETSGGAFGATIMDNMPIANIPPFGMCQSMANPVVAAATAAKLGVFSPMPCVPMTTAPWMPGVPTVMIGNFPAIDNNCKLMCNWGGVIQITMPGQVTVSLP